MQHQIFEMNGDIAQLGERVNGIHEVAGSIPAISTARGGKLPPLLICCYAMRSYKRDHVCLQNGNPTLMPI